MSLLQPAHCGSSRLLFAAGEAPSGLLLHPGAERPVERGPHRTEARPPEPLVAHLGDGDRAERGARERLGGGATAGAKEVHRDRLADRDFHQEQRGGAHLRIRKRRQARAHGSGVVNRGARAEPRSDGGAEARVSKLVAHGVVESRRPRLRDVRRPRGAREGTEDQSRAKLLGGAHRPRLAREAKLLVVERAQVRRRQLEVNRSLRHQHRHCGSPRGYRHRAPPGSSGRCGRSPARLSRRAPPRCASRSSRAHPPRACVFARRRP